MTKRRKRTRQRRRQQPRQRHPDFAPLALNFFLPGTGLFFQRKPLAAIGWLGLALIGAGNDLSFITAAAWIGSFVHYFLSKSGRSLSGLMRQRGPQNSSPIDLAELENIRAGQLPTVLTSTLLDAGEICHLETPVIYQQPTRSGVRTTHGTLTVTNNQLVFSSLEGGWNVGLGRIMGVQVRPVGFDITTSTQKGNGFYEVPQPARAAAIVESAVKLHKRLMLMPEDGNEQTRHIPQAVKNAVWQRDQGKCVQCGATDYLEFDHIIPHSLGGANTEGNVQLLCRHCNLAKSNRI